MESLNRKTIEYSALMSSCVGEGERPSHTDIHIEDIFRKTAEAFLVHVASCRLGFAASTPSSGRGGLL
ncbi:MAG: hypothetical protein QXT81_01070 [Candidatus Bathyarchaeia archaeon]